jgi:hypothetical protein
MVAQVRYSVAGRSGGQVTPCAVCTMHVETRSANFLVEPQNQGRRFVNGLASKPLDSFLRFGLKTGGDGFSRFDLKTDDDGFSRFDLKTDGGGFLGLDLKTSSYSLVIWVLKSPQQFLGLGLKTKQATVCRLRYKTHGRATAWNTR